MHNVTNEIRKVTVTRKESTRGQTTDNSRFKGAQLSGKAPWSDFELRKNGHFQSRKYEVLSAFSGGSRSRCNTV